MGNNSTKLERAFAGEIPEGERYFGLENFGNTCYCNSVLQALYFCQPFRDRILAYYAKLPKDHEENLLTCLGELFAQIISQKRKTGVLAPKRFVQRLKRDNELFRSFMQQDAHEFLNYLLNECCDILEKEHKASQHQPPRAKDSGTVAEKKKEEPVKTWIHEVFQGTLTNQTRCLWCETATKREEDFLDLSLDIEQNSSITSCLRTFSSNELLANADKFQCDACGGLQEAHKRMLIKKSPTVLALHLKRFKYMESLGRYKKLGHRVAFPNELKLCNMVDDAVDQDAAYTLFAVVVHVGSGPNHGHYVCLVKSHNQWLIYDDDNVELMDEGMMQTFFGSTSEYGTGGTEQGYILFYARDSFVEGSEAASPAVRA